MKNRIYADADADGRITGTRTMPARLIEIPAPLPRGRWRADAEGRILPTPDIILSLDADAELVAGEVCEGILTEIEPGVPGDVLPPTLEININNQTAKVPSGLPIVFDRDGNYDVKVLGPWPWQSNKLCVRVGDGDGKPDYGDVEITVNAGRLRVSPALHVLRAEALEKQIADLAEIENPTTEERLQLLELRSVKA